ncbi:MAG: hypothetical protein ACI9KE_001752 [Polyangiales bacterium]|jgi:hypothetical protein
METPYSEAAFGSRRFGLMTLIYPEPFRLEITG